MDAQPVAVHWRDDFGLQQTTGEVLDISMGGCRLAIKAAPFSGTVLAIQIDLGKTATENFPSMTLLGRVISVRPRDNRIHCAIEFSKGQDDKKPALNEAIFSDAYVDVDQISRASVSRDFWNAAQWAAHFGDQALPILPFSQRLLDMLSKEQAEKALSMADLAGIAINDPFLVLMLMRQVAQRRASYLAHGISTVLGAVVHLGTDAVSHAIVDSPIIDENNLLLQRSVETAVLACRLAQAWADCRHDVNAEEVALAALLANIGELLLWHFSPDVPQGVEDAMRLKEFASYEAAQKATCGFMFRDLSLACVRLWKLPNILGLLLQRTDSPRAAIPRISASIAATILRGQDQALILKDLDELCKQIPNQSPQTLVRVLEEVSGITLQASRTLTSSAPAPRA